MAFFPNFLTWRYRMYSIAKRTPIPLGHNVTCEEVLLFFRKNNMWWEPHLFLDNSDLYSNNKECREELYEIAVNSELRKVLNWISKRILLSVGVDNYLTMNVYIRIGTSMLNKLVDENIITKQLSIFYHDNLVRNIGDLISDINEESLPF